MSDVAQITALDKRLVHDTILRLSWRVAERFPGSGLSGVAQGLLSASEETDEVVAWIERPNWLRRILASTVIAFFALILVGALGATALSIGDWLDSTSEFAEVVMVVESLTNELLLISAAVLYLVTAERRAKRNRVIHAVNRLRSIAHVIDAHQLTKDPAAIANAGRRTEHSPARDLAPGELARYLDYCSELLSMVAKLGFLYVQRFDDSDANHAVNELEVLCTGLSRKIWQKLMVLDMHLVDPSQRP
ncbi:hypothetical protein [Engelhardtia mirabilis]|uniref:Uncharacterized protein n=1 Tax=Engelhardtia mirabilis TaxID=2528011 RepID=A0A518BQ48_9BACT|nr:hypothetical protein Pla133_42100 [Planctomycetes bacterium Pla133]QDV03421.1 hypothetical protein Pla86_42090 [Planctomycetes bacterium Pla86]